MARRHPRGTQLVARVVEQRDLGEGRGRRGGVVGQRPHGLHQVRQVGLGIVPAADLALEEGQQAAHAQLVQADVQHQRGLEALAGLLLHVQVVEADADLVVHVGDVHLQRQRVEVGGDRLARPAQRLQRAAQRLVVVDVAGGGRVERAQRVHHLGVAALPFQAMRPEAAGQRVGAVHLEGAPRLVAGLAQLALAQQRARQVERVHHVAGHQRAGLAEAAGGVGPAAGGHQVLALLPLLAGLMGNGGRDGGHGGETSGVMRPGSAGGSLAFKNRRAAADMARLGRSVRPFAAL
ncbi:hypothetical protein [Aquabacterium sp. J223]|uniref:hypothetical protein n=1 Tax=Aquabacterium sp. J223 TaxID=2898431 RepID=UPI0021ADB5D8|nr:hypothetical protein [Aquabacterium sp. J223]UUX94866.1 hypothetical protein LRS07_16600 [Aquabacterium sp. J223]